MRNPTDRTSEIILEALAGLEMGVEESLEDISKDLKAMVRRFWWGGCRIFVVGMVCGEIVRAPPPTTVTWNLQVIKIHIVFNKNFYKPATCSGHHKHD